MTDSITIGDPPRQREFSDLQEMERFVLQAVEQRQYDTVAWAALTYLSDRMNGDIDPRIERAAERALPIRPQWDRPATPLAPKIEEAAERRAEKEADRLEALERLQATRVAADAEMARAKGDSSGSAGDGQRIGRLREQLRAKVREKEYDYALAREAAVRANARHNALLLSADRWRATEALELHHDD